MDVACYALIFYYLGVLCKKYEVFKKVKDSALSYFVLSVAWAYSVYLGGLEIAVRNYGTQYGMAIIGAFAATMVLLRLAKYMSENLHVISVLFEKIGSASIILLMIHSLFSGRIALFIGNKFDINHFTNMFLSVAVQVGITIFLNHCFQTIKHYFEKNRCSISNL